MRRWVVPALVALLALGCGRSEGEEFREDSLRPAQQRLERSQQRVVATLRVVRPRRERDARALGQDVDRLRNEAARVAGLVPPDDARPTFDRYVRALRRVTTELHSFRTALRRGDEAEMTALSQRIAEAVGTAQREREDLDRVLVKDQ
jgi:hypothetical protein